MPITTWLQHPDKPCGVISLDKKVSDARRMLTQAEGGLLLVVDNNDRPVALLDAADIQRQSKASQTLDQTRQGLPPLVSVPIPEAAIPPSSDQSLTGVAALLNPSFLAELLLVLIRADSPGALLWQGDRFIGVLPRDTVSRIVPDDAIRQVIPRTAVGELPGHPRPKPPTYSCSQCGSTSLPIPGQGVPQCPIGHGPMRQDP
jgi:hypothetical protein